MKNKIIVINGPNLNLLGEREKSKYGNTTLNKLKKECLDYAKKNDLNINFYQSNIEGEIVEKIQEARNDMDGLIINAGGYTHTSVAIGDAIKSIDSSVIEIHITNTFARDDFRHVSYITPVAKGLIVGFGLDSYRMAVESVLN